MIASLTGIVQAKTSSSLVINVSGVGYQVFVPGSVVNASRVGDQILLHTALIVREDAFVLFGFVDIEQLDLFDLLRSVSGVGPKTALAVISTLSAAEISNAVANDDAKVFEKVSGVGAKTAKLIVVTLAGKLTAVGASAGAGAAELLLALQGLGWPERIAEPVVADVMKSTGESALPELIRASLAILGANK